MNGRRLKSIPLRDESGYALMLALLVLVVVGIMGVSLLAALGRNQQHVSRDRSYTQSLAVAEAGLNQYLWMVAAGSSSEANDFEIPGNTEADLHKQTFTLADAGTYTIEVTPPDGADSRISVTVTGQASSASGSEVSRTVSAHIGRPHFSEYILLVDEEVSIGGPLTRVWHGKTHSNTGIKIETSNINDTITCAQSSYNYSGAWKNGIWSETVPSGDASRALWSSPVPPVDFGTVTSDFVRLSEKAIGDANLPYVGSSYLGWYIKLLDDEEYQVARVTAEYETKGYSGTNYGGYLTTEVLSTARPFPDDGVIYVNDDVWIEGTLVEGRITIASSGQLNGTGQTAATSINVVGDLTYAAYDGTVAIGLIAQNNVKIPMYAPRGKTGTAGTDLNNPGDLDMRVDAAIIAQEGAEYVSRDSSNSPYGPRRRLLTLYGSISSHDTPTRATTSGTAYCGFAQGANTYDPFLLHNPPPYFPTIGSYQILDWQELPDSLSVASD